MADIEYIIPGGGIVNDTNTGTQLIIPALGIYNEQAAAEDYDSGNLRGLLLGVY